MVNTLIATGATLAGGALGWIIIDKLGVKFITKYCPKVIFPMLIRFFQKIDDIIDNAKESTKFKKSVTEFEKQLIDVLQKFIDTLKK